MVLFQEWFFSGTAGNSGVKFPGYKCILDYWLLTHAIIAVVLTFFVKPDLTMVAAGVCAFTCGAILGIVLRLGSNFYDLQKTPEIKQLMDEHPGGHQFYAYNYTLTVFIILSTALIWAIASLGLFTYSNSLFETTPYHLAIPFVLYFLSSMSLRSAYSFLIFVQTLTVARRQIEIELMPPRSPKH